MTAACCVSTELASQEGHGPRTLNYCTPCFFHVRLFVYSCLMCNIGSWGYLLFFIGFAFSFHPLCFCLGSKVWCSGFVAVSVNIAPSPREDKQRGIIRLRDKLCIQSLSNNNFLAPPHWHSWGENATLKGIDVLFALFLFLSHLLNQTTLHQCQNIYVIVSVFGIWARMDEANLKLDSRLNKFLSIPNCTAYHAKLN